MMAMPEATRLAYLALLGIEQWVPRAGRGAEGDGVAETQSPGVDVSDAAVKRTAAVPAAAPVALPAERIAQLDAMLAQAAGGRPAPRTSTQEMPGIAGTEPTLPAAGDGAERIGCSLLPLADGLLLVAAFGTPQAPGLSGPEHALLANIAAALVPGAELPATLDFSWPPAGMRVPGMEKPGAGREALVAMLTEQRKRGARDVVVLGAELATLLGDAITRQNMVQASAPALAVLLADPQAKRACWEAVRSLRRVPRG
ncbi:MAG: hypothetical protein ACOY9J_05275 [Pseudomonadota bacterium]